MLGVVGMRDSGYRTLLHVADNAIVGGLCALAASQRELAIGFFVTREAACAIVGALPLRLRRCVN